MIVKSQYSEILETLNYCLQVCLPVNSKIKNALIIAIMNNKIFCVHHSRKLVLSTNFKVINFGSV